MERLNLKLRLLQNKIRRGDTTKVMIVGLGSVGMYLFDYLVSRADSNMELVIVGRNAQKLQSDVNIIRTSAAIRGVLCSKITIDSTCDLDDIESIVKVIANNNPDIIVNTSRVYAGLKYGSISWHNLRAYGIWSPLAVRYIRNIMQAYERSNSNAIVINTSYSDAVIPWLRSAGEAYPDFGSGNLNHLIPRIKFYIAQKFKINNLNEIDVTIATSHFHDVVISKEGHSEGQHQLLSVKFQGQELDVSQTDIFKNCSITMPTDQKRNMMNASSNYQIIDSILLAIREEKAVKVHSPGFVGNIGGYPVIINGHGEAAARVDDSVFSFSDMEMSNRASIYLDGIEDVKLGNLIYTNDLLDKVKTCFGIELSKVVSLNESQEVARLIIEKIIKPINSIDGK